VAVGYSELETKLIELLKLSEAESKARENRLLEQVQTLAQQVTDSAAQVQKLAQQQTKLIEQYNIIAGLLNEELQR
jgi:predicted HAD superfamily Cof-like phosphohydrolase